MNEQRWQFDMKLEAYKTIKYIVKLHVFNFFSNVKKEYKMNNNSIEIILSILFGSRFERESALRPHEKKHTNTIFSRHFHFEILYFTRNSLSKQKPIRCFFDAILPIAIRNDFNFFFSHQNTINFCCCRFRTAAFIFAMKKNPFFQQFQNGFVQQQQQKTHHFRKSQTFSFRSQFYAISSIFKMNRVHTITFF